MSALQSFMKGYNDQKNMPATNTASAWEAVQQGIRDKREARESDHLERGLSKLSLNPDDDIDGSKLAAAQKEIMSSFQGVSEMDQYENQINAMISSGDPTLQAAGLSQLAQYRNKATTPATVKDNRTTDYKNYVNGLGPGEKPTGAGFRAYEKENKTKMFDDKRTAYGQSVYKNPKTGEIVSLPEFTKQSYINDRGLIAYDPTSEDTKSSTSFQVSEDMLDELEVLAGEDDFTGTGLSGYISDLRGGNDSTAVALNTFLNAMDKPISPKDARAHALVTSLGNQLLQAFRGAAVGPEEKADFIKQLPSFGQDKELFMANLQLTKQNLAKIRRMKEESSGVTGKGNDGAPPGVTWID